MALQLELGKKYLNRRGEVVEVVYDRGDDYAHRWESQRGDSYTDIGAYFNGVVDDNDLVSEYVEPSSKSADTTTKVPHKHADLIIAWAQGESIEYLDEEDGEFYYTDKPSWDVSAVYRIKPEKKVEQTYALITPSGALETDSEKECNVKFTFEDGKLIKAEVL